MNYPFKPGIFLKIVSDLGSELNRQVCNKVNYWFVNLFFGNNAGKGH